MKSQNHQDLKPRKTLQKAEKIDFCYAKVCEAISYHIVAFFPWGGPHFLEFHGNLKFAIFLQVGTISHIFTKLYSFKLQYFQMTYFKKMFI